MGVGPVGPTVLHIVHRHPVLAVDARPGRRAGISSGPDHPCPPPTARRWGRSRRRSPARGVASGPPAGARTLSRPPNRPRTRASLRQSSRAGQPALSAFSSYWCHIRPFLVGVRHRKKPSACVKPGRWEGQSRGQVSTCGASPLRLFVYLLQSRSAPAVFLPPPPPASHRRQPGRPGSRYPRPVGASRRGAPSPGPSWSSFSEPAACRA